MWLIAVALGQTTEADLEVTKEVIVWSQPYARFDDKRWLFRSEVVTPSTFAFGSIDRPLRANAWQIEAVVHCRLGEGTYNRKEAACQIEAAALRVNLAKPNAKDEAAIDAMAASLVGTAIAVQAKSDGRVPNVDLDGLPESNATERRYAMYARGLVAQLAYAFHADLPNEDPVGKTWITYEEPLLQIPSAEAGLSSVEVSHTVSDHKGNWVLQSEGRATSQTRLANPSAGMPCSSCAGGIAPEYLEHELRYANRLSSVAVIDPREGFVTEKVWTVRGGPTAGSFNSQSDAVLWNAGTLRLLGDGEHIALGWSGVVGPMGAVVDGMRPWVSVTQ